MSDAAEDISREYLELALSGLQSLPGAWVAFFDRDLRYVLAAGGGLAQAGFDSGRADPTVVGTPSPRARIVSSHCGHVLT